MNAVLRPGWATRLPSRRLASQLRRIETLEGTDTRACDHPSIPAAVCLRHPTLGGFCSACLGDHLTRRHLTARDAVCDGCARGRPGMKSWPALTNDPRLIVGGILLCPTCASRADFGVTP